MNMPLSNIETNTVKGSQVSVVYDCNHLWASGQLRAISLLKAQKTCPLRGQYSEVVRDFGARAGRIAAAYARFYLEQEPGCNPELKGRFYWMGLAAFASKQVKCGLDFVKTASHFSKAGGPLGTAGLSIGKNALGKGNFWLFQDIYVWHWFYANYPEMFAACSKERNASKYPAKALATLNEMPWAEEVLGVIDHFSVNAYLRDGFVSIAVWENTSDESLRRELQFESLMSIADHEQRKVLQPLIYNSVLFRRVLDVQQAMEFVPWLPQRLAAFSTTCDVDDPELKVKMEEGDLYDENARMEFIGKIAKRYHMLMNN